MVSNPEEEYPRFLLDEVRIATVRLASPISPNSAAALPFSDRERRTFLPDQESMKNRPLGELGNRPPGVLSFSSQTRQFNVLLVEDQELTRAIVTDYLWPLISTKFVTLFEADRLLSARKITRKPGVRIDCILLDLGLPDATLDDHIGCLKNEWSTIPVVALSAINNWNYVKVLRDHGLRGFIPKNLSSLDFLVPSIEAVLAGFSSFPEVCSEGDKQPHRG